MITQITGLPAESVGFKMTGQITKEDYDTIVVPAIEKAKASSPTINMMLVINTDLSNFTAAAWMKDAAIGLQNLLKVRRVAIVSDSSVAKNVTTMADKFIPGEYKAFSMVEEAEATGWISEIPSTESTSRVSS